MKYEITIASYYVNPETLREKIVFFFLGRYAAVATANFDSREVTTSAYGRKRETAELNAENQMRYILLMLKNEIKKPLITKEEIKSIDFNV